MVSVQVILLAVGLIGFFATGGLGKIKTAKTIAQQDFMLVKAKFNQSDFVNDIKAKTKSGLAGSEG